jgi:hypothetical protein
MPFFLLLEPPVEKMPEKPFAEELEHRQRGASRDGDVKEQVLDY